MYVVATAGHVDHGKSALVRALTGIEPDRWAEERRRGMTIDLGYAWTTLPSGRRLAFVDVPGHERFMTNMLAGVGPVPAVLFVVAADEGWRAQSAEHLAALDLLGVRHGVLAVTRADLADPAPATAEAQRHLAGTSLGTVEAVAVDSLRGTGLPALRAALDRLVAALPEPDLTGDVRLWVDRVFTVRGTGEVVTGTLDAGTLRTGDLLVQQPSGGTAHVRALQALGEPCGEVGAVARAAVSLRRADRGRLRRGCVLTTPGAFAPRATVDVRLSGTAPDARLAGQLTLHIGTAAVGVRVRRLDAAHARLELAEPLPLRIGDVTLLRDHARRALVARAGVLDVAPPPLTGRGRAGGRARELAAPAVDEVRRRHAVRVRDLRAMGAPVTGTVVGQWCVDPGWWREAGARLVAEVTSYAAGHPDRPGMPLDAARDALGLPDRELARALVAPPLAYRDGRLYAGPAPASRPASHPAVGEIRRDLAREPFQAPDAQRLAALGVDDRSLAAAVDAGELLRVAPGVYLAPGAREAAVARLAGLDQPFTASQARQALGTSRRVVLPLLALLDRHGLTERVDDLSHRVRAGAAPPGECL